MFSWHCDRKQSRQFVEMAPSELIGSYSRRIDITGRRELLPGFIVEALFSFFLTFYFVLIFIIHQKPNVGSKDRS